MDIPSAPDTPWEDLQFRFDGKWMPDIDPMLIGPHNYQELQNLRYKDTGLEGVSGYQRESSTPITTYKYMREMKQLRAINQTYQSQTLCHARDSQASGGQGRVYWNRGLPTVDDAANSHDWEGFGGAEGIRLDVNGNTYFEDASTGLQGRMSDAPQTNLCYCNGEESLLFGGTEQPAAAVFLTQGDPGASDFDLPIDVTNKVKNTLSASATTDYATIEEDEKEDIVVMTTRPIQAIKFDLTVVQAATGDSFTLKTWNGSSWAAVAHTDGTDDGTASFQQDGTMVFTNHQYSVSEPWQFEELYLYAYHLHWNPTSVGGDAETRINNITVDYAMQPVNDVWDGVYRQPIQFQVYDGATAAYFDYTLHVNESSDVNAPVGAELDGQGGNAADKVYIMFEDKMAAIRFTMLADKVNTNPSNMSIAYWDGDDWAALVATDGTSSGGASAGQSGIITWDIPGNEEQRTLFGSFGYAYRIDYSAGLVADCIVDICTGVPAQKVLRPADFSALYGSRLMLGGFTQEQEPNRMDYSVSNAPDVWNGFDSSDDTKQSLYFGNNDPIVAAEQIYNRFGASVYAMLLVLKRNEVYILVGDTPEEFIIYSVATTVGCIAPKTLATAEIGIDLGQGITRNVAMWISHSGPMMFDGAILTPIQGVSKYFDPDDSAFVNFDAIEDAIGWVDPIFKEYNVLLPTGSTTNNDLWLVYDLQRRKWYTKSTGNALLPQAAAVVSHPTTGEQCTWGGSDEGNLLWMEKGTKWDGIVSAGITQSVMTGDFFPSGNIWDETTIRKFKLFMKKLVDTTASHELSIFYYTNTNINPGSGVAFYDANAPNGVAVNFTNVLATTYAAADGVSFYEPISSTVDLNIDVGLNRVIKIIDDQNRTGWAHAFQFKITTDDVAKAFQPIAWGIQYRISRKDNTDNS
jgi:hypothetical protein